MAVAKQTVSDGLGGTYDVNVDTQDLGAGVAQNQYVEITVGAQPVDATHGLPVSDGGLTLSIDDGSGSLTVDNGGTFAVQDSQVVADNAGFTDGTTKVFPAGYVYDEVAGTALTENDAAAARINANRSQVNVIEDGTTRGRYATVSASNALKVDGSAVTQPVSGTVTVQDGGSTISVDDGASSLTIDNSTLSVVGGGTEATAMRVTLASDSTGVISVDDNGTTLSIDDGAGSLTVDNAGTFAVQDTQAITDNAGFTDGTSKVLMSGYIYDEVAGTALTENDAAAGRINVNRAQVGVIEDGATRGRYATVSASNALKVDGSAVTQPVSGTVTVQDGGSTISIDDGAGSLTVDNGGTFAVQAAQSGTWNITNVSGTVSLPTGAAADSTLTGGTQKAIARGGAKGTTVATDVTSTASGVNHQGLDVVIYDTSGNPITSFGGATPLTDNAAFTDGTSTVTPIGFIYDEVAGTALTENDVAAARINVNRAQVGTLEDGATRGRYGTIKAASTAAAAGDTSLVVQLNPSQPALTTPLNVNTAQVNGITLSTGTGASGTGTQRVVTATDSTIGTVTSVTNIAAMTDVVAQSTALGSTKNLMVAGSVTTSNPTYTTGNINPLSLDTTGQLRIVETDSIQTAQNIAMNSTANAVTVISTGGVSTATVQVTGTWTGTIIFEGSVDGGTNYFSNPMFAINSTGVFVTTATANGQWQGDIAGFSHFRVRCSITGTGTAVVSIRASSGTAAVGFDSPLPAGTNAIGAITNVATIGTSVTPGTAAANLGKAEDAAAADGDTGVMSLAVRTDTPATTTNASGDYHPLEVDANGALWVHPIQSSFRIEVDSAGLTTATTAYTSGDHAGTVNTFASAARVSGWGGVITGAALIDKSQKVNTIAVELWLFQSQPASPGGDNAALTFADTDMSNFVGIITFDPGSWKATALNSVNSQQNLSLGYTCAATSLFGYYVLRGVPSGNFFSAVGDLRVSLQLLRD